MFLYVNIYFYLFIGLFIYLFILNPVQSSLTNDASENLRGLRILKIWDAWCPMQ